MNSSDEQREIDGRPRTVIEMDHELKDAVKNASQFILQSIDNFSIRNCIWAGQSDDGRKHADQVGGEEPFPWEGASDTRIRLADEIINDHVIIKLNALLRSNLKATSIESQDMREAGAVTAFLQWLFSNKMQKTVRTEGRLIANWEELYGHAIMAVTWDQELRYDPRTVTYQELQAMGQQLAQQAQQLAQQQDPRAQQAAKQVQASAEDWRDGLAAIFDETREEEVAAWLKHLDPEIKNVQSAIKSLRTKGTYETRVAKVTKSQPCWTAMRPYRDVFYPVNTTNIDTARWLSFRECLSPAELRLRIETDEYDRTEVEETIKTSIGDTVMDSVVTDTINDTRRKILADEMQELVEIFCFYERVSDDDGGITIQKTVFAPGRENPLWEGESQYTEYPAVKFIRFQTERLLVENEGVPEKVDTQQAEIKTQRDYRVDRSSIAIMPPVEIPQQRQNMKLQFGPNTKVPVRKRGEVGFMEISKMDPDTILIEQQTQANVDSYFARWKEGVHPARMSLYSQLMVDDFLGSMSEVARKTLALARQYWTDELFARVTGVKMPFAVSDQRGPDDFEFDITLRFNASDLDLETVYKKLDVITKAILPADTMGKVDRGKVIQWAMQAIDYSLAENVVKSDEGANYAEIEDEQVQFTKIAAGVDPPIKEGGQNAQMRLQVLQGIMKGDPGLQQRYQSDELFKKRIDKRAKAFQFQLDQQKNAQIGRLGVDPAPALGGNGNGA